MAFSWLVTSVEQFSVLVLAGAERVHFGEKSLKALLQTHRVKDTSGLSALNFRLSRFGDSLG